MLLEVYVANKNSVANVERGDVIAGDEVLTTRAAVCSVRSAAIVWILADHKRGLLAYIRCNCKCGSSQNLRSQERVKLVLIWLFGLSLLN